MRDARSGFFSFEMERRGAKVTAYDLVFCGSLLLHLTDPIRALWRLQSVTREQAIIATAIRPDTGDEPFALSESSPGRARRRDRRPVRIVSRLRAGARHAADDRHPTSLPPSARGWAMNPRR